MPRPTKLTVESLERRDQPTVFGSPWPTADRLTMSFAPDGATIAGYSQDLVNQAQTNGLFAEMNTTGATAAWQRELLRAFQTWAVATNVNIGLIADAGSPFGPLSTAPGNTKGGDIRVGAFSTTSDVIAINQPYSIASGAWAGSLLFNTAQAYSLGAQAGKYDLFTTALNEAGNIFGAADTATRADALFGHYIGAKTGLTAADIAAVQGLYGGARKADAYESNETLGTARRINPYTSPTDSTKWMVSAVGDLTTMSDVDYFVLKTKTDTTTLTFRLNTAGYSLLTAKVTVYDNTGAVVATSTSGGPLAGQDIAFSISNAKAGVDYKVKIERATNDVFGIGGYELKVGYNFAPGTYVAPVPPALTYTADAGTNETFAKAAGLSAVGGSSNKQYVYGGVLSSATDVDWFKLNSPSTTPVPLTVILEPQTAFGLYAKVTVYDRNGVEVAANVLANGQDGRYVVQVPNPTSSSVYYLKVESVGKNGAGLTGNYKLNADFTLPAVTQSDVAAGTLTEAVKQAHSTLTMTSSTSVLFSLSATTANQAVQSGLRMIIFTATGGIVATLTADAGQTTSATVLLGKGTYYLRFEAATRTGVALPNLTYKLRSVIVSDPIDVYDPTVPPPPPPPSPPPPPNPVGFTDPWSNPWSP